MAKIAVRVIGGVFFVDYGIVHFCGSRNAMLDLKNELEAAVKVDRQGLPYPPTNHLPQ